MVATVKTTNHQRPHGNLPMGKGLCQQLADQSLRPNLNEFNITNPKPVDQDALTGLSCHIAPFSRAADLPGNVPFAPQP